MASKNGNALMNIPKRPGRAAKKPAPAQQARHTDKPDPQDIIEDKTLQIKLTTTKRSEIKAFAAAHNLTVKELLLRGYMLVRKTHEY